MDIISGVIQSPLSIIAGSAGHVFHALKLQDPTFAGFGEAYFSSVNFNAVKGWKKHSRMVLNIVVPVGQIKFVLFDDREESPTYKMSQEIILSPQQYQRLTVPPGVWMAFKGMAEGLNMLLNIASIEHDPNEAESLPLKNDLIPYDFGHG